MKSRALDNVLPRWTCQFIDESISRNQEFRVSIKTPESRVVLFETDKAIWIDVLDALRVKSRAKHFIHGWQLLDGTYLWSVSWESHGVSWLVAFNTKDACDNQWVGLKTIVDAEEAEDNGQ